MEITMTSRCGTADAEALGVTPRTMTSVFAATVLAQPDLTR
jgi:hypothetical protein